MAKEQIVGVVFLSAEDKARAQGNEALKEYLYKDTLGCAVGEIVVVEARDSISLARVTAIYTAIYVDPIAKNERPMRHVVSKVESSYTKKLKEKKAKCEKMQALENTLREMCAEAGWYETFKAMAKCNDAIATVFNEYNKLREEVNQ